MDVFGTTITAGTLIVQYLGARSGFSQEAKSLKARLAWDLRVLSIVRDYFDKRRLSNANHSLPPDDAALLEQTSEYLDLLVTINRSVWIAKRSDQRDMEKEAREWTERFDVRVSGLPQELRIAIPESLDETSPPPVLKSSTRLRDFISSKSQAKKEQAQAMLLRDTDALIREIETMDDISSLPLQYGEEKLIFSSRTVSSNILQETSEFDKLVQEMVELAAAMGYLDHATGIRLLKVNWYLYFPARKQFLFAHVPPYDVLSMMTLEQMIGYDPFPNTEVTLNRKFKIAYKLAEAVFFLHTAGFLHKNIISSSVVILHRISSQGSEGGSPMLLDESYLMGFDLIRSAEATTYKEGTSRAIEYTTRNMRDFDIYQHPDRLQESDIPRYIKTYDVCSLRVILLTIGFWVPLSRVASHISVNDRSS
ncbi:hypothetical protein DSL72_007658 [Monilinia vaccinii-corymbosi]|uniref:Protein kinase domain-containing protein n=1 Tax=Monilinia vaccinii-corymbosi TaxID=61207 RepID=A0A8A3PI96_9HELO|nr:hypothetical protein DSL72_007658 [Monilinia vaccinii-corymbosi]